MKRQVGSCSGNETKKIARKEAEYGNGNPRDGGRKRTAGAKKSYVRKVRKERQSGHYGSLM